MDKSKLEGTRPKREKTGGRKKGTPNKISGALKDAILEAAKQAGGGSEDGMIEYLKLQATLNPGPFLGLLGKVLPMQVSGEDGGPVGVLFKTVYENKRD